MLLDSVIQVLQRHEKDLFLEFFSLHRFFVRDDLMILRFMIMIGFLYLVI